MSVDLKDLLKMILRDAGAEILDRDDEFIWAKTTDGLYLYRIEDETTVDGDYVVNFIRRTEQIKGYRGIICLKGCKTEAMKIAEKGGVELTSKDEFARIIGEFIIKLHERGESIPLIGEEDVEVVGVEDEVEEEESEVIPIFLEDVEEGGEKIIKPLIPELKALQISRNYVKGFKSELNLLPYYVFEYSLLLEIEGEVEERSITGLIAVNAINKNYELWKTGYETVSTLSVPHIKTEPRISLEDAQSLSLEGLIKEYTSEKEVKIEDENITIIEKRKTRPKEKTIKLNFIGLYYFPVWVITGREGTIKVDAVSGNIIRPNRDITI